MKLLHYICKSSRRKIVYSIYCFFLISESPPPPYCLIADRLRPEGECIFFSFHILIVDNDIRVCVCVYTITFHGWPYVNTWNVTPRNRSSDNSCLLLANVLAFESRRSSFNACHISRPSSKQKFYVDYRSGRCLTLFELNSSN